MNRIPLLLLITLLPLLCDLYVYQGLKIILQQCKPAVITAIYSIYWGLTGFTITLPFSLFLLSIGSQSYFYKYFFIPLFLVNYSAKLFIIFFLMLDDIIRLCKWGFYTITNNAQVYRSGSKLIPRSTFLIQAGMLAAAAPILTLSYGIISGSHDYRIRRIRVRLPHLPTSFDGLRIGQLSDIHSGSFFNKKAVKSGVDMLLGEKPDIIFFTGDLVNDRAEEVYEYIDIFSKLKAHLGVYSVLGNHDYGDYVTWPSASARYKNSMDMRHAHRLLGWNLLLNEHKVITVDGGQLAVIGVENWGTGRYSKYGKLAQAYRSTESTPVKLLLSHDPSHWDAEIRPKFKDIDITFSGHTHGGQIGIEQGAFKWSPVQYRYKQWAGLYQTDQQYLYVNRGFGYIGYPGRVGILPELTILELTKG